MEKQVEQKKALVLDTNFIIQNIKDIRKIVEKLRESHTVYISQVSVDERIAQKIRDMRKKYKELETMSKNECSLYSNIVMTKSIEDAAEAYREGIQMNYQGLFGDGIIPLIKNKKMLDTVLMRANDKTPPFVEGASDKGFKDTLIWLSVLEFFKNSKVKEVIFISDDNGFLKAAPELIEEFKNNTGRAIEFKTNAYCKELINEKTDKNTEEVTPQKPLPDVSLLRKEIDEAFEDLIWFEGEDSFGGPKWERTFDIYDIVDESYAKAFFDELSDKIQSHIFEARVLPSELLCVGNIEMLDKVLIPIERFEAANRVYESVKKNYAQYLDAFYLAFTQKINKNYQTKPFNDINADDLPF